MPTIAYLFSGDDVRPTDLDLVCRAIFAQVLSEMPGASFHLRSGGILLWTFSSRTTAIQRSKVGKYPSVGHTESDDKALRSALAVAFARSVAARYHRIDTGALPSMLMKLAVECITSSELSITCSDLIHREITKQCPAYLGCFEVDKGDPLLLQLAANGLTPFCSYRNRALEWLIPFDERPEEQTPLSWPAGLQFSSVTFSTERPGYIPSAALSHA